MQLATILSICALGGSVALLVTKPVRVQGIVGAIVAGIEVAIAFGLLSLSVSGLPLPAILGAILAVVGVWAFVKSAHRIPVAGATVVALVGMLQTLAGFDII